MNYITIAGSLGRDAEMKYMANGDPLCAFSVADSQGKDKETIWWSCALYGKRAEALVEYLKKGQAVTVVGRITERAYTDKSGTDRKVMNVNVSEVMLQGKRAEPKADPVDEQDVPF